MRPILLAATLLAGAFAMAPSALAQAAPSEVDRHKACIIKIDTDAKGAYEDALQWMTASGDRPAARHCAALALIELGQPAEGAIRLEDLANAGDSGSIDERGVYLAQAGNAWLIARNADAAIVALTNAMKLKQNDSELLKDRARAFIMKKEWEDAGADLNAANNLAPRDDEALRLRAGVLKELKRYDEAWGDISTATAIAPTEVKNVVVRGDIRVAIAKAGLPDPIDKAVSSQPDIVRPNIVGAGN
ncbi:MAG TPA: tetratricopeptide repeat protein [Hyphomonadaceae bacterium]|jgi:tetratricopeptide (TPR) repeat protein|nr:tetratricopeptide repeat protein [Hyphomonadaceae bacterium]